MLKSLADKLDAAEPLSREDGLLLFCDEIPLEEVGALADRICRRLHGAVVWYNVNTHLNPTNLCKTGCPLCAFRADSDSIRAYTLTVDDAARRARDAAETGCTEIHIVGGLHPDKPYSWYRELVEAVHRNAPTVQIKAWTAPEIVHLSEISSMSVAEVLQDMRNIGLRSLPGGGAEIFATRPRRRIAPKKIDAQTWLDVHGTAHRLGIPSNATMLFGHVETRADRIDHLLALRDLQEESVANGSTAAFEAFVPLVYQPHETLTVPPLSADEILRTIAIARLMLHNIPHIKAYWVTLGLDLARRALHFGANDLDGTVRGERVHHDAGSTSPRALTPEELRTLISDAGFEARERDSRYRPVAACSNFIDGSPTS